MPDTLDRLTAALADRYAIERELGAGGMATVYLAEDLKHHRKVAVKVLRPELAAVLGAERFVQEITTTANLQHPHILPLFDSGEADSFLYYVMPFIDGETLRDKLNRETQFGIEEAVRITTEVADALDYAHRNNVIHRDIKPENILLHDERPMVADFGIALAVSAAAGGRMTETGMSLGTPHYMSPEQATADKNLTNRSDIYSLGCVLYEMLAGEPPHTGGSAQAIVMKIVADEARPVAELRKSVPPHVAAATAQALEKLAADRFGTAKEFAEALTNPAFTLPSAQAGVASAPASAAWNRVSVGLAALAVALLGTTLWGWLGGRSAPSEPLRFSIVPEGVEIIASSSYDPIALSPDGRTIAFTGRSETDTANAIYLRDLDDFEVRRVANTDGAASVFFSPDGQWLGFKVDRELRKVPIDGGASILLASDMRALRGTATWGPDGRIAYASTATRQRLSWVGENGEEMETMLPEDWEFSALWSTYVPNGRGLIFQVCTDLVCTDESLGLHVLDLERREVRPLREEGTRGWALESGHLLYSRDDGAVMVAPFDLDALELTGPPVPLLEGVQTGLEGIGRVAVSSGGSLVYLSGEASSGAELFLVDREGVATLLPAAPRMYRAASISPDGRFIAASLWGDDGSEGRIISIDDGVETVFQSGGTRYVTWVGRDHVGWGSDSTFYVRPRDLSGASRLVYMGSGGPGRPTEPSFTPDGSIVIYGVGRQLVRIELGQSEPLVADTVFRNSQLFRAPALSHDGNWVAFVMDETGGFEVYVRRTDGTGGRYRVSLGGGLEPEWSPVRLELFYRTPEGFFAARLQDGDEPTFERKFLFDDLEFFRRLRPDFSLFDVHPDGERFLMIRNASTSDSRLRVVVNWLAEYEARVRGR
jgi:serine/threonine-protein kinase